LPSRLSPATSLVMQKANSGIVRCGIVIGCALTFLLCSPQGILPRTAVANVPLSFDPAPEHSVGGDFDLRATGFDLHQAANTAPILKQFMQDWRIQQSAAKDPANNPLLDQLAILAPRAANQYREAFALIAQGDYAAALTMSQQLVDPLLQGHVLAARLLAKDYHATYEELSDWLKNYRDLPQAERIYALAMQRRAKGEAAPAKPSMAAVTHGSLDENGRGLTAQIHLDDRVSDLAPEAEKINDLLRQGQVADAATALAAIRTNPAFPAQWAAEGEGALAALRFFGDDVEPTKGLTSGAVEHAPLAAWIAGLQAWRVADYSRAAQSFAQMVAQEDVPAADRAAGYYWHGRALQKTGDEAGAKAAWRKAAGFPRCFYGQLARARLGAKADFAWEAPHLTKEDIALIASNVTGQRGLALLQIGQRDAAHAELRRMPLRGQTAQAQALLALAQAAQMPTLAMQLGSLLKRDDGKLQDSALYPVPPWQIATTRTDDALVYAVMRHESGFDPAVISSSGARGLMQLMPETARHLDAEVKVEKLCEPTYNAGLGARYLDDLAAQPEIMNNVLLLLAAYNAGPGNLARWRTAVAHNDDPLLFIESLPVRETRHYVQNVLSSYWMYQSRLGTKPVTLQQLAAGQWPALPTKLALAEPTIQLASR